MENKTQSTRVICGKFVQTKGFATDICGYSTTVSASAFQAEDVGSIPITRSNNMGNSVVAARRIF